jgi:hypothetical protein
MIVARGLVPIDFPTDFRLHNLRAFHLLLDHLARHWVLLTAAKYTTMLYAKIRAKTYRFPGKPVRSGRGQTGRSASFAEADIPSILSAAADRIRESRAPTR